MEKVEKEVVREEIKNERLEILQQLEDWLETPMFVLSFIWLALFIIENIWSISPFLENVSNVIWIVFIVDFAIKFILARKNRISEIELADGDCARASGFARISRISRVPAFAGDAGGEGFAARAAFNITQSRDESVRRELCAARFRLCSDAFADCYVRRRGGNVRF